MSTTEPTGEEWTRDMLIETMAFRRDELKASGQLYEMILGNLFERALIELAASSPSAPTEDDREALEAIITASALVGPGVDDYEISNASDVAGAILAEFARRSPVAPREPGRLDPDWRAALVDAATHAIKAVWADVPGGVDAETLAQNVVSTQEFFWLSPPVAPSEDDWYCTRCGTPCERHRPAPSEDVASVVDAVLEENAGTMRVNEFERPELIRRLAALRSGAAVPVEGADTMFTSEYVDALRAELTAVETVSTVEELDALPAGSVVRTAGVPKKYQPRVAVKSGTYQRFTFGKDPVEISEWLIADSEDGLAESAELDDLPARVLFRPDREEGTR